ncbi:MAG TPA: flagellar filament capping protein FliD [Thermoguttaceae bacterium]|nr:flagellar filament capping protein FliD [Thermoguttaceae bacterium]
MGRIQTNIGLITGIPIGDTIEQLMKLAARPRDLITERTDDLTAEQVAITDLMATLVSVKFVSDNLGKEGLYDRRKVTSSDTSVLTASSSGTPPKGTYQFTPLRTVQSQQLLGSGFKTDTESIGGGRITFRFGDDVRRSTPLEYFGGGAGVQRGIIRITDRSGARADVDLSTVRTVDDVLEAINGQSEIDVTAVAYRDGFRLIDNTGQTVSNLKVQEVNGSTAASLGLDGIDVAGDVADGRDMLRLYDDLDLDALNDGSGVRTHVGLHEIEYTLRDGSTGKIDFSVIQSGSSNVLQEKTLGDLLEAINAAAPGDLRAEIAPDGDRLVLTDLTEGGGTFELVAANGMTTLADLGLEGATETDGVVVGRRITGGSQSVLLASLGGGSGLGPLGTLELRDRSGASDTVDLSTVETLEEVVDAINAAAVNVTARINRARNGIELIDTSGNHTGNLVVANADATNTADELGIAVDDAVESVNSGDLHLQIIAENTLLADLNGGAGVAKSTFRIVDGSGRERKLDLKALNVETVGDLIRAINGLDLDVRAEINRTGDGILLCDTGTEPGTLRVLEGNSTTAADLHLLGSSTEVDLDGALTQVIDGSTTYTIELDDDPSTTDGVRSLADLRQAINDLGAGVTAMIFRDGSSTPFRLGLSSDRPGEAGRLIVDTSAIGLDVEETVRARDALLVFGDASMAATSILVSSSSNVFRDVLPDVTLKILKPSDKPVVLTVETSDTDLVATVQTIVDNYNKFRTKLNELTRFDPETGKGSVLTGDGTALRLDLDLSALLSGRFFGAGSIQSLAEIGVDFKSDGTLAFDSSKLKLKFADDPSAVKAFFSTKGLGVSAKFSVLLEQLSGVDNSLLTNRADTLSNKIASNQQRIDFLNERLEAERERLYMEFYRLESAIAKIQNGLSVIDALKPLAPLTAAPRLAQ